MTTEPSNFLITGSDTGAPDPEATLLLAHGAGAAMDSAFMNQMADLLADRRIRVIRFEFPYMVSRRLTGKRKPAPKAELLMDAYKTTVTEAFRDLPGRVAIGGKSMGGRVASLVADQLHGAGAVQGLVCLGYPFHPPGTPDKLRTAHLASLKCPALIVQGERDPFGTRDEVEGYVLSKSIAVTWMTDGDHDFGPRGASGVTRKANLTAAADAVAAFLRALPAR